MSPIGGATIYSRTSRSNLPFATLTISNIQLRHDSPPSHIALQIHQRDPIINTVPSKAPNTIPTCRHVHHRAAGKGGLVGEAVRQVPQRADAALARPPRPRAPLVPSARRRSRLRTGQLHRGAGGAVPGRRRVRRRLLRRHDPQGARDPPGPVLRDRRPGVVPAVRGRRPLLLQRRLPVAARRDARSDHPGSGRGAGARRRPRVPGAE